MTQATVTLTEKLDAFRANFIGELPEDVRKLIEEKGEELARSGITERSLGVGDEAPDFELPDAKGKSVRFSELLKEGPVVLNFYRGGWCPYCNLELRAFQQVLPEIEKAGATLVAVSPETSDNSLSTTEKNELQFQVLSDGGNAVARKFGLVFTLADALRPIYEQFGIDIPKYNGDDSYEIPVPATYVIDQNRIIRFSFVNTDYTQRAEPAEVVAALQQI